jgi:hypothetical protein
MFNLVSASRQKGTAMKTEAFIDRQSIDQLIETANANRAEFLAHSYNSEKVGKAVRRGGLMALITFGLAFISARHVSVDHSGLANTSHPTFSRYY